MKSITLMKIICFIYFDWESICILLQTTQKVQIRPTACNGIQINENENEFLIMINQ